MAVILLDLSAREIEVLCKIESLNKSKRERIFSEKQLKKKLSQDFPLIEVLESLQAKSIVQIWDRGRDQWQVINTKVEHLAKEYCIHRDYPELSRILKRG